MANDIVPTAIAGGDSLLREGLRRILEDTRYRVDAIAPSIGEVMGYCDGVDLVLLLGFSDGDSRFLDAFAELRGEWPKARIVVIAANHAEQLTAALKAGVHGYLARHISAEALLRFLALVMLGQRIFSTTSLNLPKELEMGANREDVPHRSQPGRFDASALTPRERRLLAFLVEGHSNKVIARELGIAEATVKAQMVRLFGKIGATNRTQAAVLAWSSHPG